MTAPETAPGQAAWLAFVEKSPASFPTAGRWEHKPEVTRAAWEAAAQAAIDVFLAGDSVSAESIREALAAQERPAPELATSELAVVKAMAAESIRLAAEARLYREQLAKLRDGIAALAGSITASASATRPSAKSRAEDECAAMLRQLLEES